MNVWRTWRLILMPPAAGARQMAVDEALLDACAAGPECFVPTLRFHAFTPACLSLGRFQPIEDVDLAACTRRGIVVVRRPSGGRAVLHDRCLTYALVAPIDAPPFAGGVRASAHRIGGALATGLHRLGADVSRAELQRRGHRSADCFAAPGSGEIVASGRKLAGSAQVRRGGAALQHGTIRLRADAGIPTGLLRSAGDPGVPPSALDTLLGRPVTFTEVAQAVTAGFKETFGVKVIGGPNPPTPFPR
ncbi:MAG: lipoate--protein ligase family protein, partial [Dehalococcoidia bacterium]